MLENDRTADVDGPLFKLVTHPEADDEEHATMHIVSPVLEPDTPLLRLALPPTPRVEDPAFNDNSPPMSPELEASHVVEVTAPPEPLSADPTETLTCPPDPDDPSPDHAIMHLHLMRRQ